MSEETMATGGNMSTDSGSQSSISAESLVKRRGRKPAQFWVSFTAQDEPYKSRMAPCRHCLAVVGYHKKWEQAKSHLMRCDPFLKKMQALSASERPEWFLVELEKRRRTTSKMLPLDLLRGDGGNSSQTGALASPSSPSGHVEAKKGSRVPAMELLVLQAMRTGAKIDEELVKYVIPQQRHDTTEGLRALLERAYERVHRSVSEVLRGASKRNVMALVVVWEEPQKSVSYWAATHEMSFFLETSHQDGDDPVEWLLEDIVRLVQLLDAGAGPVVVDAPLEWTRQLKEKQPAEPKLQFRPSPRRVLTSMVRELLLEGDTDTDGPLEGWLAVALTCQDVLALATTPQGHHRAWTDPTRQIISGTTRSITVSDALYAIIDAEGFLDPVSFRESLVKSNNLDEASIKRVCDTVGNAVFTAKLKQFLAVLKPLVTAISELSKSIVRVSDVLVTLAALKAAVRDDAGLTDTQKDYVLKAVEKYADDFQQDEYLLAHVLDPAYLGEFLNDDAKRHAEHELLLRAGDTDEDKQALYSEYTDFQVAGLQQRDHADGFIYRMLKERRKTVVQYWLTDGRRWPRLQAVALAVEKVPADANLPFGPIEEDASGLWDPHKLAYMRANAPRLSVAELLEPAKAIGMESS